MGKRAAIWKGRRFVFQPAGATQAVDARTGRRGRALALSFPQRQQKHDYPQHGQHGRKRKSRAGDFSARMKILLQSRRGAEQAEKESGAKQDETDRFLVSGRDFHAASSEI